MKNKLNSLLNRQISEAKSQGLYKSERIIDSSQSALIEVGGKQVLNLCSNNYLGLSSHPEIIAAAKQTLSFLRRAVQLQRPSGLSC